MSGIWTKNDEQTRLALESKAREEKRRGATISTEIAPLREFTLAEDYHQKYELRSDSELMKEFEGIYTDAQFVNSTAAMRLNAAIGGQLKGELLRSEIDSYGLSPRSRERVLHSAR